MAVGSLSDILPKVSIDEVKDWRKLLPKLFAEMIGTMLLTMIGCGSCIESTPVQYGLCFGITVATIAQSIGHISGCHINPAVTFGLVFGRKIELLSALLYIVFQCIGALLGAGLLKAFIAGYKVNNKLITAAGVTKLSDGIGAGQVS